MSLRGNCIVFGDFNDNVDKDSDGYESVLGKFRCDQKKC